MSDQGMNKELKEKWLEALRSGKYKQGTGTFRNKDNCFCCLGVLADIIDPSAWIPDELRMLDGRIRYEWNPEGLSRSTAAFDNKTREDIGFTSNQEWKLIDLNDEIDDDDNHVHDFNAIANYIEENL